MKKYLLRYLIFWAPAFLVVCFFNNSSGISQVLQWFFAFFMLFGWCANTAMASYHYPRYMLSGILIYSGVSLLLIVALYYLNIGGGYILMRIFGAFSFAPLDIFVGLILDYSIPHEIYVTGFLIFVCLLGCAAGALFRKIRPDPYRPTINK